MMDNDDVVKWMLFTALLAAIVVVITLYIQHYSLVDQYNNLVAYVNNSCTCIGQDWGACGLTC